MADLILDGAKLDALNAAITISKAYADKKMAQGHLSADQYSCFQDFRSQLDELAECFAGVETLPPEGVH